MLSSDPDPPPRPARVRRARAPPSGPSPLRQVMNSLDHRNVIKLYEIFDEAKYMKLVMMASRVV